MACHVILYFQFLCILAFVGTSMSGAPRNDDRDLKSIFDETEMGKAAHEEMSGNLNRSVDPCYNFWAHACGGWKHRNPEFRANSDRFEKHTLWRLINLSKEILENEKATNSTVGWKLSKIHRSCIKFVKTRNDNKTFQLLKKIVRNNGGWPITFPKNKWHMNDSHLTLQKIHDNYAEKTGHGALYDVGLGIIEFRPGNISHEIMVKLPERRLNDRGEPISADSVKAVVSKFAGSKIPVADINDGVEKMMKFEKSWDRLKSVTLRHINIRELQSAWNKVVSRHREYTIDWLQAIRRVFGKTNIAIDEKTKIFIEPEDMVEKLGKLLNKNRLRTVVDYIHWNAIAVLAPYADKKMADHINGPRTEESKTFHCLTDMDMDPGLIHLYVKRYFENFGTARKIANDMISGIAKEITKMIMQSSWIDRSMKSILINRIENVIRQIGYPKWYDEPDKIDGYYNELVIGSNYFDNRLNYNEFRKIKLLKQLNTSYDRNTLDWKISPLQSNTFYYYDHNSIYLPAEIFRMPFFHKDGSLAFGSLGYFIGHELGHVLYYRHDQWLREFGDQKHLIMQHGIKFNKKAKDLVHQYNRYRFPERKTNKATKVNGTATLEENIADHTGVRSALNAYISHMKKSNPHVFDKASVYEKQVKRFFYALANIHCASLPSDGHDKTYAPHSVRLNVMVSNMPEFADAFNCPTKTPMRPLNRTSFWE